MKVAIIGRTEILYETARHLAGVGHNVVCILTSKEAPEYSRSTTDFRALADEWSIPFASGSRITEHAAFLQASHADIAVSVNYTGVVPQAIIDLFPLGILNAHGGDLPRYRGNACQAWAIINGERQIGLCIHRMIGGELDSGDILAREYMDLHSGSRIGEIYHWMTERVPVLFQSAVKALEHDPNYSLERQSKDAGDSLRCYPRKPEDGALSLDESVGDIVRLINASSEPFEGAFVDFEGERMTIWRATIAPPRSPYLAVTGQVLEIGPDYIDVHCLDGAIRVTDVTFQGVRGSPPFAVKSIRSRLRTPAGRS